MEARTWIDAREGSPQNQWAGTRNKAIEKRVRIILINQDKVPGPAGGCNVNPSRLCSTCKARTSQGRLAFRGRRKLGMVFQGFNLFWHKTVMKNMIGVPMLVLGEPEEQARQTASALLERVGLSGKENVFPGKLSGGQQQRAAIARALAMSPEVMLFDEPTSAIDPEMTGEVLDVMTELAKSGLTMIVVTHEMGFAKKVGNRAVMMEDCLVKNEAPTSEFFDRSRNARLDAFLSSME